VVKAAKEDPVVAVVEAVVAVAAPTVEVVL
jgi:hypothetical protein